MEAPPICKEVDGLYEEAVAGKGIEEEEKCKK